MRKFNIYTTASAFVLAASLAAPVHAQVEDEVIVTATKRAESIQDVPVSVSAVSVEEINELGVIDFSQLAVYLPNFEINNSTILPNLYVRGLGSGATHSIEQSVGRFVDEVYIGRGAMSIHGFFDLAGVEVLRGPQGTLFGKNTVAGAMIVRTADPTEETEVGVNLTYGDYSTRGNYQEIQGYISGSMGDNLRSRLALRYRTDDGYYINRLAAIGPDGGPDRDDFGIRGKLEWDLGDNTTVGVKLDHQTIRMVGMDAGEINAVGGPPGHLQAFLAASPGFTTDLDWQIDLACTNLVAAGRDFGSFCPGREQDTTTATFRVDHKMGMGTLTSLSAFQTYEFDHRFFGIDGGALNGFRAYRDEEYDSFTQEVRFTSDLINDNLDFIVGAYYENSDVLRFQTSDVQFFTGNLGPIALQRNEPWSQGTETFAAFAQARYNVSDQIRLIVGGRYSDETKDYVFDRFFHEYGTDIPLAPGSITGPFGDPTPLNATDSRSESKFTPAVTIQFDANEDINVYATYSQGHKTGGFSERIDGPGADFEFDAETNNNFELGLKSSFLDGRLKANVAAFHMSVEGLQLATQVDPNAPIFSVDNAAEVTSKGIEFDAVLNVTDSLSIGADYAYTDATYDDFVGAPACPASAVVNGVCDLSGFVLNFAPKHKGSAFIDYFTDNAIGEWGAGFSANIAFSDEYFTDISYADSSFEDGYTIIGGNIRLVSPDDKYSISLIGKNLTDEVVLQWGIPTGPNSLASLRSPREFAVKFGAKFH